MKSVFSFQTFSPAKTLAVGALAVLSITSSHAQDERGKQLYNNCVACHGADGAGNKLLNAPSLTDLSEKYVAAQLQKFKAGHRGGTVEDLTGLQMAPMTQTLRSEEDIQAVSKYVASLPSKPVASTLEGGDPARGQSLYATCQACHGADAAGNDLLNAPSLRHQYDWYLLSSLHKFKDGVRGTNPNDITGSQMRPMALTLADEQAMLDVIAYIESLSE